MRIAIVGGTGKEGRGLAVRWARAGHAVAIGSRDGARGAAKAEEFSDIAGVRLTGGSNLAAVEGAEIVVLSVPYAAHRPTLEELAGALQGKLILDITVPLKPPKVREVHLPAGQAAALEAQALLGDGATVVAALHHVSSVHLSDPDHALATDVLVCGTGKAARDRVMALIADLGARPIDAGPLANAVALESLTPVLLYINKRYDSPGAGLKITGLPE
jgi:NADPH-dependent F420 reductase